MKKVFLFFFFISMFFLSGCDTLKPSDTPSNNAVSINKVINQLSTDTLPSSIATLSELDFDTIDNFEKYNSFVNNINNLIDILKEQTDFDIEYFNPTKEGWEKASKLITEYSPLINNYNEVVLSAKKYDKESSEENLKSFYLATGKFSFETALIAGTVFYSASYNLIGVGYRGLGMNTLAFKCPTCVSMILSEAHWTLRASLVESSSQIAQKIVDIFEKRNEEGTMEELKKLSIEKYESAKNIMKDFWK